MSRDSGYVEVWDEGGAWYWLYGDPSQNVLLLGNRTYPTREAVMAAARTAYRNVPIREPGTGREQHPATRTLVATALGALGASAALGLRARSGGAKGKGSKGDGSSDDPKGKGSKDGGAGGRGKRKGMG